VENEILEDKNNVVSIFVAREARKASPEGVNPETPESSASVTPPLETEQKIENLTDSMRRNQENLERMRKERNKANQSVLRSYRIKN